MLPFKYGDRPVDYAEILYELKADMVEYFAEQRLS